MATIFIREGTVLPERRPDDHYPTPSSKVQHGIEIVQADLRRELGTDLRRDLRILDPGAGDGVWGRACREAWPDSHLVGAELRDVVPDEMYDDWLCCDFLSDNVIPRVVNYDLVVGNPPYRSAEGFVRKSLALLRHGGRLLFLLRLAFLESQRRGDGLFVEHPPKHVTVCKARPSFTGNGKTDATAYALFLWRKGWRGETTLAWK